MKASPPAAAPRRQILASQCEKERGRRRNPNDREGESQDRSDQIALKQRGYEKTDRRNSNACSKVPSPFMPLVRMATNQDHADDASGIWDSSIDSDQEQVLDSPAVDQRRQPKHHGVGGAQ
jgi:hypothetical protein